MYPSSEVGNGLAPDSHATSGEQSHMPWDTIISERDRAVYAAAGYGKVAGLGIRPVLLVVDVNNGFCGDRPEPILESIARWRTSCGEVAWRAIPLIASLCTTARAQGVPAVFTTGTLPGSAGSSPWGKKNARYESDRVEAEDIVAPLAEFPDLVIAKDRPSAFFGTLLASKLVAFEADTVVVCGTTTSGCVRATVLDAYSYGYNVAVVTDATFDRGEVSHQVNLFDMGMKYADLMTAEEVTAYLVGLRSPQPSGH